jgi:Rrf2 family transcriptional regulator, iron-sulfur cluster assembly transcription factor
MRITAKARYAVTALLDIALQADRRPIALIEIAHRQNLSLPYLEQLFCRLRKQGLVSSVRGPTGGYRLSQSASSITISMILQAVEERVDTTHCLGLQQCQQGERCLTHPLWSALNERIHQFLGTVTLSELSKSPAVQQVAFRQADPMLQHQRIING